jgi:hypothetical protein
LPLTEPSLSPLSKPSLEGCRRWTQASTEQTGLVKMVSSSTSSIVMIFHPSFSRHKRLLA